MITGEIINYADFQKLKRREEYIKLEESKTKLTVEDFEKVVEAGSWKLLNMIANVDSVEQVLMFLSDQIANAFDLDFTFENSRTFLHYAVARGERLILEKLIQMRPALVSRTDGLGRTPLHYAVTFRQFKLMNALIHNGANPLAIDAHGQTPLHFAAIKAAREFYLFLKFKGADGSLLDSFGLRPLDYIRKFEDYQQLMSLENTAEHGSPSPRRPTKTSSIKSFADDSSTSKMFITPAKSWFDRRRTLYYRLGLIKPNRSNEPPTYYHDHYSENLAKRYLVEQAERERNQGTVELNLPDPFDAISGDSLDAEPLLREIDSTPDLQTVKATDFVVHGSIGKGSFGTIFCVSLISDPSIKYAIKSYKKSKMLSNNLIRFLFVEKKVMTNFSHPFLCKLFFSFQNEDKLFLVMEYCDKRDISTVVRKLDEVRIKLLACELILAVQALHEQGFIHRDIKPENILIGSDGHIRLADFGLSKERIKRHDLSHTFCGSIAYLPPEIMNKTGHNKTIDWYLIGEVLYEMIYGTPPYFDRDMEKLSHNILNKNLEFPSHETVSDNLKDLIEGLLVRDISKRLGSRYGAKEIMEHPFFVGIDWTKVYNKEYTLFDPSALKSYSLQNSGQSMTSSTSPATNQQIDLPYWSYTRP